MQNAVQVFKGSINEIEDMINSWALQTQATILNTSLCYDQGASMGHVFVVVVYERAGPSTP